MISWGVIFALFPFSTNFHFSCCYPFRLRCWYILSALREVSIFAGVFVGVILFFGVQIIFEWMHIRSHSSTFSLQNFWCYTNYCSEQKKCTSNGNISKPCWVDRSFIHTPAVYGAINIFFFFWCWQIGICSVISHENVKRVAWEIMCKSPNWTFIFFISLLAQPRLYATFFSLL